MTIAESYYDGNNYDNGTWHCVYSPVHYITSLMAMNCNVIDTFLWSQITDVRDRKRGIKQKIDITSPMPRHAKLKSINVP